MKTKTSKKITKVISINSLILLIFIFSPGITYYFLKLTKKIIRAKENESITTNIKANYPTYDDKAFSNQIFLEFSKLKTQYRSFLGWRRDKVNYKYTNIEGKYNKRKSKGEEINNSSWFFGGSTMWGTGSSDDQTIPSQYHLITNKNVYNFGESGWNSRQSLNQLLNLIGDGYIPNQIIFYDGVNDVIHGCRSEIKEIPSHSYEELMKRNFANKKDEIKLIRKIRDFILEPYLAIGKKLSLVNKKNVEEKETYDCDTNTNKSKLIAKHLVNNWHVAFLIAKQHDSNFYGILQPTIYTSNVKFEYFHKSNKNEVLYLEKQYASVYPEIILEMKRQCIKNQEFCKSIINGSNWMKSKENIFIDFCHISGKGNKIIANNISKLKGKSYQENYLNKN